MLLSADGKFLGVHVREKDAPAVYAPDIGAAANGTRYCNPLIEKAKIPLGIVEDPKGDKNVPTKHDFFLSMLDDGSTFEPVFAVLAQALRDQNVVQEMSEGLIQHKLKGGDPIGFMVDGAPCRGKLTILALVDQVSDHVFSGRGRCSSQVLDHRRAQSGIGYRAQSIWTDVCGRPSSRRRIPLL